MFQILMDTPLLHGFNRFSHPWVFAIEKALDAAENAVVSICHETQLMILLNEWLPFKNLGEALQIALA